MLAESSIISKGALDFEYARKCWDELKSFVDRTFDGEMNRHRSNITQTAETKLAIDVIYIII
jgi:hypothetical protein